MDEFKGNSDALRSKNYINTKPTEPVKKIEKVGDGKAVKKKSGLKELTDGFIQEDVNTVRTYLWRDILLPAFKKTLWEMVTGCADMFLYGGERAPKGKNYDRVSWRDSTVVGGRSKPAAERVRSGYSFDDVLFPTRIEAEAAYESLSAAIEQYHNVSVADLYSTAGITGVWTDNNYGWTDIRSASIIRFEDGYLLKMPKAEPLN